MHVCVYVYARVYFDHHTADDCFGCIVMDEIKYADHAGSMGNALRKQHWFHDFSEFIETF